MEIVVLPAANKKVNKLIKKNKKLKNYKNHKRKFLKVEPNLSKLNRENLHKIKTLIFKAVKLPPFRMKKIIIKKLLILSKRNRKKKT